MEGLATLVIARRLSSMRTLNWRLVCNHGRIAGHDVCSRQEQTLRNGHLNVRLGAGNEWATVLQMVSKADVDRMGGVRSKRLARKKARAL
ncbi:hypothetical protein [Azorhizobium sp. AG788]|uniref:hypothetical protein n=1 Tax=Azorhizobium sp. AG788 TaxID=2183897 RepID=UPI0010608838|nr:hypothetical protein [Azorhizobium sp. AG788]